MNEDLYDTGSAVVGLYRLFTNFLKCPGLGESIGGGKGRVSSISQDFPPPILHFSHFFQLKIFEITSGGTIPETGKKHLITLSAHNLFYNCSVKIILCSIVL